MKQKRLKRRIISITVACFLVLFLIIGVTLFVDSNKESTVQKKRTQKFAAEQTVSCVKEQGHDDAEETEEVYIQNGILISRKNIVNWSNSIYKEKTCEYYTKSSNGLNAYPGVSSTCNCNDNGGNYSATYTIAELNKEDVRLKQFDYLTENGIFDVDAWIMYMEDRGFVCKEF